MGLTICCPSCERTLRVPDSLLGQAVKCPSCAHRFTAEEQSETAAPKRSTAIADQPSRRPAAPPPDDEDEGRFADRPSRGRRRPADDYDDEDHPRDWSARDQKAGWNKVRIGINLVIIGIWVWLGGIVLASLGGLLSLTLLGTAFLSGTASGSLTSLGFGGIVAFLSIGVYYLAVFADVVLRLTGYGLCLAAPPRPGSGLKPLAIIAFCLGIASVVLAGINFAISGFSSFMTLSMRSQTNAGFANMGISFLSSLCAIGSFGVYVFFLRSVCMNARAREHAFKPIAVLIALVCFWVVAVLLLIVVGCAGGFTMASAMQSRSASSAANSMGVWMIITIGLGVSLGLVYLGLYVWYAMVLQKVRDAVVSYRRRL